MARQHTRREAADQSQVGESKTTENPEAGDPAISSTPAVVTEEVRDDDDVPDLAGSLRRAADRQTAEAAPVVEVKPRKARTRAQLARDEAEKVRAEQEAVAVASAATFAVTFPTGISIHVPDEDEVEITMSGGDKVWIDAVGGFVHLPLDARWKPKTLDQLREFASLAGLGYVKQVAFS